jgi:hypothetical protein
MHSICRFVLHVFAAVFTYEQMRFAAVVVRIRTEVPCIDFIFAQCNFVDVFHFRYLRIRMHVSLSVRCVRTHLLMFLFGGGDRRVHFFVRLRHMIDLIVNTFLMSRSFAIRACVYHCSSDAFNLKCARARALSGPLHSTGSTSSRMRSRGTHSSSLRFTAKTI